MNDILIFLTGMIICLIANIYKDNNDYNYKSIVTDEKLKLFTKNNKCYERENIVVRQISFMSLLLSIVIILIANALKFTDAQYFISGAILIIFPIVFIKKI